MGGGQALAGEHQHAHAPVAAQVEAQAGQRARLDAHQFGDADLPGADHDATSRQQRPRHVRPDAERSVSLALHGEGLGQVRTGEAQGGRHQQGGFKVRVAVPRRRPRPGRCPRWKRTMAALSTPVAGAVEGGILGGFHHQRPARGVGAGVGVHLHLHPGVGEHAGGCTSRNPARGHHHVPACGAQVGHGLGQLRVRGHVLHEGHHLLFAGPDARKDGLERAEVGQRAFSVILPGASALRGATGARRPACRNRWRSWCRRNRSRVRI